MKIRVEDSKVHPVSGKCDFDFTSLRLSHFCGVKLRRCHNFSLSSYADATFALLPVSYSATQERFFRGLFYVSYHIFWLTRHIIIFFYCCKELDLGNLLDTYSMVIGCVEMFLMGSKKKLRKKVIWVHLIQGKLF